MNKWSKKSLSIRAEIAPVLVLLFDAVLQLHDCAMTCGKRGEKEQNAAYDSGASTKRYPNGKHNTLPLSDAVDVYPCINGIKTSDIHQCYFFSGIVYACACKLGIQDKIRWGGDWNKNINVNDQTFNDLVHYEVV